MIPDGDPPAFPRAQLKPGDILLCHGDNPLADWVQCASGKSNYYHAALFVGGNKEIVEAIPKAGVSSVGVTEFLASSVYVDVYRVHDDAGEAGGPKATADALARLAGRNGYNYAVIPIFIALHTRSCDFPTAAIEHYFGREVSYSKELLRLIAGAVARRARQGKQPRVATMTCSQLVFECYRDLLEDDLAQVVRDIIRMPSFFALRPVASRFTDILIDDDTRSELASLTTILKPRVDVTLSDLERIPAELQQSLLELLADLEAVSAAAARDLDEMPLIVQAEMQAMEPELKRIASQTPAPPAPDPLYRDAVAAYMSIDPAAFTSLGHALDGLSRNLAALVTPAHLSRSPRTSCVGRMMNGSTALDT